MIQFTNGLNVYRNNYSQLQIRPAEFNISAIHTSIPDVSDTFSFAESVTVIKPLKVTDVITMVDTAGSITAPFTSGIIFRSPFRFIKFKSPKRDISEPTYKRISFKTYPRKLLFKSIKRIDP